MTREEAIAFGKMWLEVNEDAKDSGTYNFFKISIKALEQELTINNVGKHVEINAWDKEEVKKDSVDDRSAARLANLTFIAHFLTTEELLKLRTIITKELLTRPDYMRKKILGTLETTTPEEEREIKMLKKIRKYCNRFKNCDGCELKTANAQDVEICIFNAPPCSWLDPEIEKVNEVLKENKE